MSDNNHFAHALLVVEELVRGGASVRVWSDRSFERAVLTIGAEFSDLFANAPLEGIDDSSRPFPSRFVTFASVRGVLLASEIRAWGADRIIYDSFAFVGRVAAHLLNLPYVPLFSGHALYGPRIRADLDTDPRVSLDARCVAAVKRLQREFGLLDASPFSYVADPSPFINVHFEPEEWLVPEDRSVMGEVVHFGSLPRDAVSWHRTSRKGPRRVYAAFGSIIWRYWAQEALGALMTLSEVVSSEPETELRIGLGGAQLPGGVIAALEERGAAVSPYAKQCDELAAADFFVTHHGLASTHEAVALAVPMLSLPFFWDQPRLAARCFELGLALPLIDGPLPGTKLSSASVREQLWTVEGRRSSMDGCLQQARAWEIRTIDGRSRAAQLITSG